MFFLAYILILLVSFVATVLFTVVVKKYALRIGFVDHPNERKFHTKATPLMGGVALFFGFWITVLIGLISVRFFPCIIPSGLQMYVQGIWMRIPWLFAIFAGAFVISGVGLWDDKFVTGPMLKLILQIVVALFIVACGIRIKLFLPVPLSYIITILWILIIVNAFNLIDNMDGVSSGVALMSSLLLLLVSMLMKNYFITAMLTAFIGTLFGFLLFNFPPAAIFMGDCGSMFIGYMMSIITILGTYYKGLGPTSFPVVIPLLVLAVPLFDVCSVIVIRILTKKPVFYPDKNHFSHRLVNAGMPVRTAVLFLYLVTLCVGMTSILIPMLSLKGVIVVLSQAIGFMVIIAILEFYAKSRKN